VKAALNTFSKVGYDASTTREIAKHAGVNESLIHRYFKNKLGLFFAVIHEYHRVVTTSLPYEEGKNVHEEISNFIRFRRDFSRERKKFLKLLITKAILDPKVRVGVGELSRNGVPGLVQRFEKLRSRGQMVADVNLEHLSVLLTTITFSMAMFTDLISTLDPGTADAILQLAINLLTDALEPKPKG
jgi:AcrR family transcriptional regulator